MPYYGRLPNYFSLWLKSAGYNQNFDFFIFSDENFSSYKNISSNIKIINLSFDDIKRRISKFLDFNFVLDRPYKLCDYKPLYGLIFQDFLKDYDFWGHCDPDIIWGDMDAFITPDILQNYDRLYRRGHLCLYRNDKNFLSFALNKLPDYNISFKEVYSTPLITHFDENALAENLFDTFASTRQWDRVDFADIAPDRKPFVCSRYDKLCETLAALRYDNGKLYGLAVNGDINKNTEYLYVHLQKRKMTIEDGLEDFEKNDKFLILPTGFVKNKNLSQEDVNFLMERDEEWEREWARKNCLTFGTRLKRFLDRGIIASLKAHYNRIAGKNQKLKSRWEE